MATLGPSSAESLTVSQTPSASTDVVRKSDLDAVASARPTTAQMNAAISAAHHAPASFASSRSMTITVNGQQFTLELKPVADSIIQIAESNLQETFLHPVIAGQVLELDRERVLDVVVTRQNSLGGHIATGVEWVDYVVDYPNGTVTITAGSNLITADTQRVVVNYGCDIISDGSALLVVASGARVNLGEGHHQAARGDHGHALLHPQVAADPATQSTTVTLRGDQKLKVEVKCDPAGNLEVGAAGLKVSAAAFAVANHTHGIVDNSNNGLMTSAMLSVLNALANTPGLSIGGSSSINVEASENAREISVKLGYGMTTDENGITPNPNNFSRADHKHDQAKSLRIVNPTNAENATLFFTPVQLTAKQIVASLVGTGSLSATFFIKFAATRNAAGTSLVTAGNVVTQNGISTTTLDATTIPANSFVWITTTAKSGTVSEMHVSLIYA